MDVVPAILVKSREELLDRIRKVAGKAATVHVDVMDNEFVPNKTVGPESFANLPVDVSYEFHWMVKGPERYILETKGGHMHIVHVEAIREGEWGAIVEAVKKSGGRLGLAISPKTSASELLPYMKDVSMVLVMTVVPGFDGQPYMPQVEEKIRELRGKYPGLRIEVDGGINPLTAKSASHAGANVFAASSAIFRQEDAGIAIEGILKAAKDGRGAK